MGRYAQCKSCNWTNVFDTNKNVCNRCGYNPNAIVTTVNHSNESNLVIPFQPVLDAIIDCYSCGEEFNKEFLIKTEDGFVCNDCLHEAETINCYICDCSMAEDEGYSRNGFDYCENCYKSDYPDEAIKHDETKLRYDLIPADVMEAYAKVLTFGANKYSARNWEKGFDYSRVFAALMRHMWAWWGGENQDPESGMSHLNHALFNVAALVYFDVNYKGTDDRPL